MYQPNRTEKPQLMKYIVNWGKKCESKSFASKYVRVIWQSQRGLNRPGLSQAWRVTPRNKTGLNRPSLENRRF